MSRLNLENEFEPGTVNQLLLALSNETSQCVVNYFRESTETVASLDELAEYVAESQHGCTADSSEQVAIRLHHSGLPKLTDARVLDYDPRTKTVRRWDHPLIEADEVSEFVEVV